MRICTAILCALLTATAAVADDWPLSRGNPAGTGVSTGTLPDQPARLWAYKTGGSVKSSPVIAAGVVYVGSEDEHLHAVDLATGKKRWTLATEGPIEAPPAVDDGRVFIGSGDGHLYAADAKTGDLLWKYKTDDRIAGGATPGIIGDDKRAVVVFGSYDNHLHCVDAATGKRVWAFESDSYINATPTIAGNVVAFGGCDSLFYMLDLTTGQPIAKVEIEGEVAKAAPQRNGKAYVGTFQNELTAIDLTKHRHAWSFHDRDFAFVSAPAVTDDLVVTGSRARRVYALNPKSGEEVWAFRLRGAVDSSPVIFGQRVVFGANDGRVYILNVKDGKQHWSHEIGEAISAAPAIADDKLVIACEDGSVYAFGQPTQPQKASPHE